MQCYQQYWGDLGLFMSFVAEKLSEFWKRFSALKKFFSSWKKNQQSENSNEFFRFLKKLYKKKSPWFFFQQLKKFFRNIRYHFTPPVLLVLIVATCLHKRWPFAEIPDLPSYTVTIPNNVINTAFDTDLHLTYQLHLSSSQNTSTPLTFFLQKHHAILIITQHYKDTNNDMMNTHPDRPPHHY